MSYRNQMSARAAINAGLADRDTDEQVLAEMDAADVDAILFDSDYMDDLFSGFDDEELY